MTDPVIAETDRPILVGHVRLTFDATRQQHILLAPESVSVLNPTGAAILSLCNGQRTVAAIITELTRQYAHVSGDEVTAFLSRLVTRQWMETDHE